MKLSTYGRTLIKGFEGLSLTAYIDAAGYSIGYGHFGASKGDRITVAQADALFDQDVARFELCVSKALTNPTQWQFDACTSLAYNIGEAAFNKSTLVKKHNAGDVVGAAAEFARWNKSNGAVHAGLILRREKERAVYEGREPDLSGGGRSGGGGSSGAGFVQSDAPKRDTIPVPGTPPAPKALPVSYTPVRAVRSNTAGAMAVLLAVFFCPC